MMDLEFTVSLLHHKPLFTNIYCSKTSKNISLSLEYSVMKERYYLIYDIRCSLFTFLGKLLQRKILKWIIHNEQWWLDHVFLPLVGSFGFEPVTLRTWGDHLSTNPSHVYVLLLLNVST